MCELPNQPEDRVIGNWTRLGEFLPKIIDHSPVRYHGHLSPLNGFEAVNSTAINDYRNGILKLRGDNLYLPVLPGTLSNQFKLEIEARFPLQTTEANCVILSIGLDNNDQILFQHFNDSEYQYFDLAIKNSLGKNLNKTNSVKIKNPTMAVEFLSIILKGEPDGKISLSMKSPSWHLEESFHINRRSKSLQGIWLGADWQNLETIQQLPSGCHFDLKFVTLSR